MVEGQREDRREGRTRFLGVVQRAQLQLQQLTRETGPSFKGLKLLKELFGFLLCFADWNLFIFLQHVFIAEDITECCRVCEARVFS